MANKTCGECKHFEVDAVAATCENKLWICDDNTPACKKFEQKPLTNGDVIRQMSNEELVAFFITRDASYCVPDACLEDCEASKECEDHWLRWLNAPAESEEE